MNILLWAPFGAGEHYWGPGISAYNLYNSRQHKDDFTLFLAHGFENQKNYELFKQQFFISDITKFGIISSLIFLIKTKLWINKNAHKFDVVHVLGAYESSFRPALWFKNKGLKVFCKITTEGGGIENNSLFSRLLGLRRSRLKNLNNIDGYIAISEHIAKMLENNGVRKELIFKIPNGVNINRFKPVSEKAKIQLRAKYNLKNVFTILFVGGISARKQPQNLLKAFILFVKEHQDIDAQLIFLGPDRSNGQEINALKNIISNKKINDLVYFFDHSNKPEEFYQLADIFCLPSLKEGMSNALLEAMACGLPSIVTPISGSADLIKHELNGLYTNGETADIGVQLFKIIKNKNLSKIYCNNALESIRNNYSSEIVLKQHLALFSDRIITYTNE